MTPNEIRARYPGKNLRWVCWCLDMGINPSSALCYSKGDQMYIRWLAEKWRRFYRLRHRPLHQPITEKMQEEFDKWLSGKY